MSEGLLYGITAGMVLGASAGCIPGPQMMYMIASSLKYGHYEGLIVAIMPLFAELPLIVLIAWGLSTGKIPPELIAYIGILGGLLLIYMGLSMIQDNIKRTITTHTTAPFSITKTFLICLLNPNPYIFRTTAGTGLMYQTTVLGGSIRHIVIGFFGVFLGINCLVVRGAHSVKKYITTKLYTIFLHSLGVIISMLGIYMIYTSFLSLQ